MSKLFLYEPNTGGKAGRGRNVSSTIQVRKQIPNGYLVVQQYRYVVGAEGSRERAVEKAEKYIKIHQNG